MRRLAVVAGLLVAVLVADARAQRRGSASVTLAITVSDQAGAPLGNVLITMTGPENRNARTERGRIALENLPAGTYRLRFDREGYISLEREVVARPGAPITVAVQLTAAPPPPEPPAPTPPPAAPAAEAPPAVSADPLTIDMTAFIEKNYIGRSPGKTSPLACTTGGSAVLLQVRETLADDVHKDADEFLYVIAGQGRATLGGREQPLAPGVFVSIPRAVVHTLAVSGRTPLVLLAVKAGDRCGNR